MHLSELHIGIVGGAIGGASLALLLARAGARVSLFEKVDRARGVGAGIAIAENGLAVLDALGLGEALAEACTSVAGVRVCDARGRTLFEPATALAGRPLRILMARRRDLYALLSGALEVEPRVECHYGSELEHASGDGTLRLRERGRLRELQTDLVVGADGVHSQVRASGDFGAHVSKPAIAYARGIAAAGLARSEEAWTAAGLFGSFALPDASYWYASLGERAVQKAVAARDLGAFRVAWARAYPPADALLGSVGSFDDVLINDVVRVRCRRFFSERRVLVGDAAHAMAPNLGQGANSALVDAAVLRDALMQAGDLASALTAYDQRRRPKVEQVARTAARLGALAEYTQPILRLLRDRVLMPLAGRGDQAAMIRAVWQEDPELLRAMASS